MTVVGFDGWRGGWIGVRLQSGTFLEAVEGSSLGELINPTDRIVGVDMPLGFADGGEPRPIDTDARARLAGRASTLFIVPSRDVMAAEPYAAANRLSKARYGRGISKQVYNLRAKIFEAIDLDDERLLEIHPEVTFAEMAGEPLSEPKKTWAGQRRRLALLDAAGLALPSNVGAAGRVPPDDIIDAAAVAWAAWKVADSEVP